MNPGTRTDAVPPRHNPGPGPPEGDLFSRAGSLTPADLTFVVADPDRHADLLDHWLAQPHVSPWWDEERDLGAEPHLRSRNAESHVVPWVVSAAGVPFAYVETYRPADDPLADAYPFTDRDRGWHVLVGPVEALGSGLPRLLGRAVLERLLGEPGVDRVICEPDRRNRRMLRFCQALGYKQIATLELANKTAALLAATTGTVPGPPEEPPNTPADTG